MSHELKGFLKEIKDERQVSDKFKLREFVLTDDSSEYPQHIQLQFTQDRCEKLNGLKSGDRVNVKFNVRGREWTSPQGEVRYFNTLEAWFIQKEDANSSAPEPQPVNMATESDDNLPF